MTTRRLGLLAATCLLAAVALQAALTHLKGGAGVTQTVLARKAPDSVREIYLASYGMYLPKGSFAGRAMAFLGGLRADIYWLKAANYVTRQFDKPGEKLAFLDDLYNAMLDADPLWYTAAATAARLLAAVAREPIQAEALLKKAIIERPDKWQLWYELGGIYLFWPGHETEAASAFQRAARLPGAPGILLDAAATLYSEGGRHEMAVALTRDRIERYSRLYGPDSPQVRQAEMDLKEFEARLYQRRLSKAARVFRRLKGRLPSRVSELAEAGLVEGETVKEPFGKRWLMNSSSGQIVSEGLGILEGHRMRAILQAWLRKYHSVRGEYPDTLEDLFQWVKETDDPEAKRLFGNPPKFRPHPVLGKWNYDPETGEISLPEGYRFEDLLSSSASSPPPNPSAANASPAK